MTVVRNASPFGRCSTTQRIPLRSFLNDATHPSTWHRHVQKVWVLFTTQDELRNLIEQVIWEGWGRKCNSPLVQTGLTNLSLAMSLPLPSKFILIPINEGLWPDLPWNTKCPSRPLSGCALAPLNSAVHMVLVRFFLYARKCTDYFDIIISAIPPRIVSGSE